MRTSGVCPKCEGHRFFDVEKASTVDPRYKNGSTPLAIATHSSTFWDNRKNGEVDRLASLSAFICAACGYTELYTRGLETLEHMAREGVCDVKVVERDG